MLLKDDYVFSGNTILKPQVKEESREKNNNKNKELLRQEMRKRTKYRNTIVKCVSTLFLVGSITVSGQVIATNKQYEVTKLKKSQQNMIDENSDLRLKNMKINNLANIEETSKGLNMKRAYIDEFAFTDLSKNNFRAKEVPQNKFDQWVESIKKIFS